MTQHALDNGRGILLLVIGRDNDESCFAHRVQMNANEVGECEPKNKEGVAKRSRCGPEKPARCQLLSGGLVESNGRSSFHCLASGSFGFSRARGSMKSHRLRK